MVREVQPTLHLMVPFFNVLLAHLERTANNGRKELEEGAGLEGDERRITEVIVAAAQAGMDVAAKYYARTEDTPLYWIATGK
jgi:hypothetical protein